MPVFENGNMDRRTNAEEHEALKQRVNSEIERLDEKNNEQDLKIEDMNEVIEVAIDKSNQAYNKSKQALQETSDLRDEVERIDEGIDAINEDSKLNLRSITANANTSTAFVNGIRKDGTSTPTPLPVVSQANAGVMNSSDYNGLKGLIPRVEALEQGGHPTLEPISIFTLAKAGTIKGSELPGQIYPEGDGTGSLVGYDAIVVKNTEQDGRLTTVENTKLSKLSGLANYIRFYIRGANTEVDSSYNGDTLPTANTVALRTAEGRLQVGTPTVDDDAINKKYFDDNVPVGGGFDISKLSLNNTFRIIYLANLKFTYNDTSISNNEYNMDSALNLLYNSYDKDIAISGANVISNAGNSGYLISTSQSSQGLTAEYVSQYVNVGNKIRNFTGKLRFTGLGYTGGSLDPQTALSTSNKAQRRFTIDVDYVDGMPVETPEFIAQVMSTINSFISAGRRILIARQNTSGAGTINSYYAMFVETIEVI